MTGLGFADGQTTWKVFDSEMSEYKTFDDVPDRFKTQLHPGTGTFSQPVHTFPKLTSTPPRRSLILYESF